MYTYDCMCIYILNHGSNKHYFQPFSRVEGEFPTDPMELALDPTGKPIQLGFVPGFFGEEFSSWLVVSVIPSIFQKYSNKYVQSSSPKIF